MKSMLTIKDVLTHEVKGLYDGERQLGKYLDRHNKRIFHKDLRNLLSLYSENVQHRLNKLEWVLRYLDQKPAAHTNECIAGIFNDAEQMLKISMTDELRDAVLTASVQRTVHYKVSVYRTCQALALELRMHNIEEILKEMLAAEEETDNQLGSLATKTIHDDANIAELGRA